MTDERCVYCYIYSKEYTVREPTQPEYPTHIVSCSYTKEVNGSLCISVSPTPSLSLRESLCLSLCTLTVTLSHSDLSLTLSIFIYRSYSFFCATLRSEFCDLCVCPSLSLSPCPPGVRAMRCLFLVTLEMHDGWVGPRAGKRYVCLYSMRLAARPGRGCASRHLPSVRLQLAVCSYHRSA